MRLRQLQHRVAGGALPSPHVGEGGLARSAKTVEGCWTEWALMNLICRAPELRFWRKAGAKLIRPLRGHLLPQGRGEGRAWPLRRPRP
ncbi:hypothetical protein MES5069_300024 [Mesorhizobium escarrei]|uniref:Uncharacterized protein n=1 Tax=Mesorhizobium escarrei TaxID=666018 RepID=A0ABN8K1H4_9HYPH|nr:hypothetical protein MES5069_300024 [Mesorhizobium escarrei]